MEFKITGRDSEGKPVSVLTDDGFMQCSRRFNPDEDGWMETQLKPMDFIGARIGDETEYLVSEVNALRKKVFRLEREVERYRTAAGF